MKNNVSLFSLALLFATGTAHTSVLTFSIDGLSNFASMPPAYGDRVVALDNADFHYDEQGEGFTPNIVVSYTSSGGQDPSWWGTGYGDLGQVYFEDHDGNGQAEIVLTADYGYEVVLYGFEMAAYSSSFISDPILNAVRVQGCGASPLFEQLDVAISKTTHTSFDFAAEPIRAREVRIQYDSANLDNLSDDIGLGNIRFGQAQVDPVDIACPSDFATPICVLNFFDVSAFLERFNANDPMADLTGDGALNFFDVSAFLNAFIMGCNTD